MDYKKIYEVQYGEQKLIVQKKLQFLGLRKILKRWDINAYTIVHKLTPKGKRVLDIGCGNGYMLFRLVDKYTELYGIDIAPSRLEEAKKTIAEKYSDLPNRFHFCEANLDKGIDFENSFFDTIICIATLEHVYDIYLLVKEIYRMLNQGGCVIVQVPNIAYLKYRIKLLLGILPVTSSPHNWEDIGWEGGHIHYFTLKKLCELFESQGLIIIEKTGAGFLTPLRNWWPSLLTGEIIIKAIKPVCKTPGEIT
jgi:methionine biosynthesis protein MetW